MAKITEKKYFLVLILLSASILVSWKFYFKTYTQKDIVNIHAFPKEIADWKSQELPITEKEYAVLETRNAFAREYVSPKGQKIILYIVYSESNRKVAHPPEICYTGGGSTLVNKGFANISVPGRSKPLTFNKLIMEQNSLSHIVYYLFKVNDSFTGNYWKQQALVALNNVSGNRSNSAMIRVSVSQNKGSTEQAEKDIEEFIQMIYPRIISTLQ